MAFYEQVDEHRFRSGQMTRGPWSPDHQHAGPPAALLGGLLADALGDGRVTRVTLEILRPVPITDLDVDVEVLRGGRRIALAQATLSDEEGPLVLARAWRLRTKDVGIPADPPDEPLPPGPDDGRSATFPFGDGVGYHTAMDASYIHGDMSEPGDAFCWMRTTVSIVEGTEPTPLQRVLVAADSASGISSRFDLAEVLFINTELTVHLREEPSTEWVGLDSRARFAGDGIGLTQTTLHGEQGPIGVSHQSLLVDRR